MKVAIEDFKTLDQCIREYNPYTCMIDSYKQEQEAKERNREYNTKFIEVVKKYNPDFTGNQYTLMHMHDKYSWACNDERFKHGDVTYKFMEKARYDIIKNVLVPQAQEPKGKKVWTAEEIKQLVQTNDTVLYKGLLKLYECQTADEQAEGDTKEHNGIGFNGVDAPILTSFSEFLNRTGFLTPKQRSLARKKLVKYTGQLVKLANGEL